MSDITGLAKLREPFPAHQISKLPKESRAQIDERKANKSAAVSCAVCGSWHHRHAVHLDYVGHAALTDRLLDADPAWSWEPLSIADGLPVLDGFGGMWIRLTVCGVTRLGYGHAGEKQGGDAIKEVIGDALRNAAMRFGAALELWHKGDLHKEEEAGQEPETRVAETDSAKTEIIPQKRREELEEVALLIVSAAEEGKELKGADMYYGLKDNEEKLFVWGLLRPHSAIRASLKRNSPHQKAA